MEERNTHSLETAQSFRGMVEDVHVANRKIEDLTNEVKDYSVQYKRLDFNRNKTSDFMYMLWSMLKV